ncbi:MAG: sugar transferase [Anaerolineae bacterium]|nr:sugar transferase [Gemmatimonadaceae bacterium]
MVGYPGKRLFDLVLVCAAAPIWLPALAIVALLVRHRLGAKVFFRQVRPGLAGRPFEMIKFRSMTDAVGLDGTPLSDAERLTPFGRKLRATSLDELPELFSVLKGDMSLVGPRPLLMRYLPLFSERHLRRHAVRPGITGLAQVSGRNALSWTEKFELDVEYVQRCSPGLDIAVLWKTLRSVFASHGISAEGDATMPAFTGYDEK